MSKNNSNKLVLPEHLVPEGAQLKNGEEMTCSKVGAFYGSSVEWGISAQLQYCNGQTLLAPADTQLMKAMKPKRVKGQLGALREETTLISKEELNLGREIMEVTTKEDVLLIADAAEDICTAKFVTNKLKYTSIDGRELTYDQLMSAFSKCKEGNLEIQHRKDAAIKAHGCQKTFRDGKWSSPEYSEELLQELQQLNKEVVAATGVNLVVTITGSHTIAKDSCFFSGKMDQVQLDNFAKTFNYKEANAFYKGSLRRNKVVIPVQSVWQLKSIMNTFREARLHLDGMSDAVKSSVVRLVKSNNEI